MLKSKLIIFLQTWLNILLILLRCDYSPIWTFASLMEVNIICHSNSDVHINEWETAYLLLALKRAVLETLNSHWLTKSPIHSFRFCSSDWSEFPQPPCATQLNHKLLLPDHFCIHLNWIQSPCRWRESILPVRWNKPLLHGIQTPKMSIIWGRDQTTWYML